MPTIDQLFNQKAKQVETEKDAAVSQARAELEAEAKASRKRVDALKASVPDELNDKAFHLYKWKSWKEFFKWVDGLKWPTDSNGQKVMDSQIIGWLNGMTKILQNPQARHDEATNLMIGLSKNDQRDPSMSLVSRVGEIRAIFKESDGKLSLLKSLQGQIFTNIEALALTPPAGPVASGPRLGGPPGSTIRVDNDFNPLKV